MSLLGIPPLVSAALGVASGGPNQMLCRQKTSIPLRNPALTGFPRSDVAVIGLTRRQLELDRTQVLIRNLAQQMGDAVEARLLLVVGVDDVPGGKLAVGVLEHHV